MQITRQSYEEFFLLYADGELSDSEKQSVEQFVAANPDLADEFLAFRDTVMQPDENVFFENKESLYRTEDDNRKIIYMRWFRIAAAAAIVFALSVVGWLFIDNKTVVNQPVAETHKPVTREKINTEVPRPETKEQPVEQKAIAARPVKKASRKVIVDEKIQEAPQQVEQLNNKQPDVVFEKDINVPSVEHAALATTSVNVPVKPRELEESEQPAPVAVDYATATYEQEDEKSDMIYFANTTISKKTKLRGVLRKATRYLDRVTSLQ